MAPQPFYEDRGTPIAVRLVIEALSELGHRVDVLTFPQGTSPTIPNVRLLRIGNPLRIRNVPVGFSLRKLFFDAVLAAALRRQLQRERYDVIHAVEEAAFPAVALGRRQGIPVVYDMQSSLPEQMAQRAIFRLGPILRVMRRCERWLLHHARAVMSSAGLAGAVVDRAPGVPVNEWTFPSRLRHPSPEEIAALRERLEIPAGARTIVYSGTFEEYQGLGQLLGALARVRVELPGTIFVLVGGTQADTVVLRREARARGVGENLRIIERRPREEIPAYLGMADVLVSARSYGGNLPLKIFDYLAAARPILATDTPTHRAVLDEDRALLVPASEEGLARGILHLLSDEEHAARLAAGAHAYADLHFGWDRFVARLETLYDEVCARTG